MFETGERPNENVIKGLVLVTPAGGSAKDGRPSKDEERCDRVTARIMNHPPDDFDETLHGGLNIVRDGAVNEPRTGQAALFEVVHALDAVERSADSVRSSFELALLVDH
jgi:hypothetical protein